MKYLYSLVAGALAIAGVFLFGRSQGKKEVRGENATKVIDDVEESKKIEDDVDNLSERTVRKRLRNQWLRK